MQILKENVKANIIEAATLEFLSKGYKGSSLRKIASEAGMTIGNIYSYFTNKENLFETVIESALKGLNSLTSLDMTHYDGEDKSSLIEISRKICDVFITNKKGFLILMNGSKGSKFENIRQEVIDFISNRIQMEICPGLEGASTDPLFAKALASGMVTSFMSVFNDYGDDEKRLFNLIYELVYVLLGNIERRP